jgi:hypothetical protein
MLTLSFVGELHVFTELILASKKIYQS